MDPATVIRSKTMLQFKLTAG
ncbi:hypothetical protein ECEC4402_6081, partial [Escherichia coli EC4402]